MLERTIGIADQALHLAAESAPYLLLGFLFAGILHELVPSGWIARKLGGERIGGVLLAALVGLPLPLCSCAVVPTADALHRKGAGRSSTLAFLISTPETSVESIALTWGLFGGTMAIVRPAVAMLTAIAAGLVSLALSRSPVALGAPSGSPAGPAEAHACGHAHAESHDARDAIGRCDPEDASGTSDESLDFRVRRALRFGFGTLFDDLFPSLLLGLGTAVLVTALLPDDLIPSFLAGRSGLLPLLLVAVASAPLYLCASAATPLAAALVLKGLSPGAALVLLLVGPATNLATIGLVGRRFGRGAVVLYVGMVLGMAIGAGWMVDLFARTSIEQALRTGTIAAHGESIPPIQAAALVVCALLAIRSARRRSLLRSPHPGSATDEPTGFDRSAELHSSECRATHRTGCDSESVHPAR
ncbi:MAG: SO_0444 family Cu/Zn efflux transporter [Myxococcota bacterium]